MPEPAPGTLAEATPAAERPAPTADAASREDARPAAGAKPSFPRTPLVLAALLAALLLAAAASLLVGAEGIALGRIVDAVLGHGDQQADALVLDSRLPRTVVAIAVGAALGVAGAVIQAYTRNPLADPGILGVNGGAALGVTLALWLGASTSTSALVLPALAGSLLATVALLMFASAGKGPATPVRMVLAGVALAAVLGGLTTAIRLFDVATFDGYRSWAAGSVAGRALTDLIGVLPYLVVGLLLAGALVRPLNAVALGEDTAASLGVDTRRVRLGTIVSVTLLVGSATAIAGPVTFLGLMVPHVCRLLVGNDQRRIIPLAALAAPVLLLASDILARVALPLREMPVGVVTAFVGAPVLIRLVSNRKVHAQ
ncbi:FecCD family ABC transporter permease [Streptomyces reniochalinae]|uniref:Iron ABC transporter permease n=1 Tax=Streptomyces reniochalinae TaxID=2250578 RepID=A0A367EQR6_9ACTN|nr:iron ABC transporter permease [Streptomyces reniochalinae]RCG20313.1 iron ABC transporter permease [Streptomyces reniochalinae]